MTIFLLLDILKQIFYLFLFSSFAVLTYNRRLGQITTFGRLDFQIQGLFENLIKLFLN